MSLGTFLCAEDTFQHLCVVGSKAVDHLALLLPAKHNTKFGQPANASRAHECAFLSADSFVGSRVHIERP